MRSIRESTFVMLSSRAAPRLDALDRRMLDVMAALLAEGAHVNLVCRPTSPLIDPARALGVEVAPYRLDKRNLIRTGSRLRKYLRRYQPPVAHSLGRLANLLLRAAAGPLRVRVVNTAACSPKRPPSGIADKVLRSLEQRTLARADAFVAECAGVVPGLLAEGVAQERVQVIPPGVEIPGVLERAAKPCPRPASEATTLVAYCGEPDDAAAFDTLLGAVDFMRSHGRDVVALALSATVPTRLARLAEDAGALRRVDAENLPALAVCADICAAIASADAAPRGLLVAGALAKPIVTTANLGTQDLFVPNREALYVPPANVTGLADALARLADDPDRGRRMGEAVRHRVVDEYGAAVTVRKILDLYSRLMASL